MEYAFFGGFIFAAFFSGAGKRRKAVFPMKNAAFPMVCRTV